MSHSQVAAILHCEPAMVSLVATGRAKIPIDRVEEWADAFKLTGSHRAEFLMLAGISHIRNAKVRDLIASEMDRLRSRVEALAEQVKRSRSQQ